MLAGDGVGVSVPGEDAGGEDPAGDPTVAGEKGAAGCRGASGGWLAVVEGWVAAVGGWLVGTKAGIRGRGVIVCGVGGEEGGVDDWTVEYGKVFSSKMT